jgi:formylglycine-generating enzyme required for sulfatase activity
MNTKIFTVFLSLVLASVTALATEPTISCKMDGTNLIVTYTGTLLQSTDAVNWTEVASASSPYKVSFNDKKLFFCSQSGGEVQPVLPGEDFSTLLPGGVSLNMIWISRGTFMMGSPEDELGAGGDETLHKVTLTRGYWLGKYEVTQAQYEAIMGENPSRFKGADQPVESVSWNDAMEFCEKLTEREQAAGRLLKGYEYTLPTEAQWEYACRAGTMTAFNNGTNIETDDQIYGECPHLDPVGWYWCNSESKTHPVGQKRPNDWGLYDMHGNVMEWCLDAKNRYPETPVVDPVQEDIEPYYAVRGGSYSYYDDGAKYCRSAARSVRLNTSTSMSLGFRVALVKKGKDTLVITINDTKKYDGAPLISGYPKAVVTGLMPGDSLISGAVQTYGASEGSYKYPVSSGFIVPFETTMGIENYDVTYVINQTITIIRVPLTITINDSKLYDGTPLVSSYSDAVASGLLDGDKLIAGAVTSASSEIGSYSYPDTSTITTPFRTAKGISNYDVTYNIKQSITEKISPGANITITLLNNENLKMIWIEPGTFIMGSPEDELGRWADETQHQVTLTKGYWMGQYAICTGYNWYQATNYCAELTAQEREAGRLPEGYEYTLPTEAQWEYACRAGTTTALNSGKNLSNWNTCPEMDEVRQESSNAWGLYNMHGHWFEWCLDWYEADYPTEPVTDPTGPSTGKFRVIRGGCYLNLADRCRSAFRYISAPDTNWGGCDFRLVLAPVK